MTSNAANAERSQPVLRSSTDRTRSTAARHRCARSSREAPSVLALQLRTSRGSDRLTHNGSLRFRGLSFAAVTAQELSAESRELGGMGMAPVALESLSRFVHPKATTLLWTYLCRAPRRRAVVSRMHRRSGGNEPDQQADAQKPCCHAILRSPKLPASLRCDRSGACGHYSQSSSSLSAAGAASRPARVGPATTPPGAQARQTSRRDPARLPLAMHDEPQR